MQVSFVGDSSVRLFMVLPSPTQYKHKRLNVHSVKAVTATFAEPVLAIRSRIARTSTVRWLISTPVIRPHLVSMTHVNCALSQYPVTVSPIDPCKTASCSKITTTTKGRPCMASVDSPADEKRHVYFLAATRKCSVPLVDLKVTFPEFLPYFDGVRKEPLHNKPREVSSKLLSQYEKLATEDNQVFQSAALDCILEQSTASLNGLGMDGDQTEDDADSNFGLQITSVWSMSNSANAEDSVLYDEPPENVISYETCDTSDQVLCNEISLPALKNTKSDVRKTKKRKDTGALSARSSVPKRRHGVSDKMDYFRPKRKRDRTLLRKTAIASEKSFVPKPLSAASQLLEFVNLRPLESTELAKNTAGGGSDTWSDSASLLTTSKMDEDLEDDGAVDHMLAKAESVIEAMKEIETITIMERSLLSLHQRRLSLKQSELTTSIIDALCNQYDCSDESVLRHSASAALTKILSDVSGTSFTLRRILQLVDDELQTAKDDGFWCERKPNANPHIDNDDILTGNSAPLLSKTDEQRSNAGVLQNQMVNNKEGQRKEKDSPASKSCFHTEPSAKTWPIGKESCNNRNGERAKMVAHVAPIQRFPMYREPDRHITEELTTSVQNDNANTDKMVENQQVLYRDVVVEDGVKGSFNSLMAGRPLYVMLMKASATQEIGNGMDSLGICTTNHAEPVFHTAQLKEVTQHQLLNVGDVTKLVCDKYTDVHPDTSSLESSIACVQKTSTAMPEKVIVAPDSTSDKAVELLRETSCSSTAYSTVMSDMAGSRGQNEAVEHRPTLQGISTTTGMSDRTDASSNQAFALPSSSDHPTSASRDNGSEVAVMQIELQQSENLSCIPHRTSQFELSTTTVTTRLQSDCEKQKALQVSVNSTPQSATSSDYINEFQCRQDETLEQVVCKLKEIEHLKKKCYQMVQNENASLQQCSALDREMHRKPRKRSHSSVTHGEVICDGAVNIVPSPESSKHQEGIVGKKVKISSVLSKLLEACEIPGEIDLVDVNRKAVSYIQRLERWEIRLRYKVIQERNKELQLKKRIDQLTGELLTDGGSCLNTIDQQSQSKVNR